MINEIKTTNWPCIPKNNKGETGNMDVPKLLHLCSGPCSDAYYDGRSLANHTRNKHPNQNYTTKVICKFCALECNTPAEIHNHQRKQHITFFCTACNVNLAISSKGSHIDSIYHKHNANAYKEANLEIALKEGIEPTSIKVDLILLHNLNKVNKKINEITDAIIINKNPYEMHRLNLDLNRFQELRKTINEHLTQEQRKKHWNTILN